MIGVSFAGKDYFVRKGETLLDALIRQGADVDFSCRSGTCQVCMLVSEDSVIPSDSQKGLSGELKEKNCLLPCKCYPEVFLSLRKLEPQEISFKAVLNERVRLSKEVYLIRIEPCINLSYVPGQFFNVFRDGVTRSYSVSSLCEKDYYLEFQVKAYPNGKVSSWLCIEAEIGDELILSGPFGESVYKPEIDFGRDLVLLATGTGLSSSIGVLRHALECNHDRPIVLIHGARKPSDLYMHDYLLDLERKISGFKYIPCVTQEPTSEMYHGRATDAELFRDFKPESGTVFISGSQAMVSQASQFFSLLGVPEEFIRQDSHGYSTCAVDGEGVEGLDQKTGYPEPIPELWKALQGNNLLGDILDDFYDIAFIDPILSPYFHNVTKQRVKEKVYSFYRRLFSGEPVYFGDRPRNAHHWMVISDDVFNYRESLLVNVLKKHGLDECLVEKWRAAEELYRPEIVKAAPRGRFVDGIEGPAGGYAKEIITIGAVCDSCGSFIPENTQVLYHLRTGHIYCEDCSGSVEV